MPKKHPFVEVPEEERRRALGHCIVSYKLLYTKALCGELSPLQAIRAKCLECCGWYRKEVENCTVYTCPLWPYRPWRERGDSDEAEE